MGVFSFDLLLDNRILSEFITITSIRKILHVHPAKTLISMSIRAI